MGDGREREFPTYDNLAEHLVAQGAVDAPGDLLEEDRDKLAHIFFEWMAMGQLACKFAIKLASTAENPHDICWISQVATPPFDVELAEEIEHFLQNEGRDAEAVALIFQGATEPEDIVALTNVLCQLPSWNWVEIDWDEGVGRSSLSLGLRWRLPDSRLENWVLGFAPYPLTPVTRRVVDAPFSVLALRTLPHSSNSFFPIRAEGAVHLANMPLPVPCPVHTYTDKFDDRTKTEKQQLLESGKTGAARARVTLPLPKRVRGQLDPAGREGLLRKISKSTRRYLKQGLQACQNQL